jgi:hypothetical protein
MSSLALLVVALGLLSTDRYAHVGVLAFMLSCLLEVAAWVVAYRAHRKVGALPSRESKDTRSATDAS